MMDVLLSPEQPCERKREKEETKGEVRPCFQVTKKTRKAPPKL